MIQIKIVLTLLLLLTLSFCNALVNDTLSNEVLPDEPNQITIFQDPQAEVTTSNKYTVIATVTAVVVVIVGVLSLISVFTPAIANKLCYLTGGCDYSLPNYVNEFVLNQDHNRKKRSVEYLAPIMNTLITAIEKYGESTKLMDDGENKVSKTRRSLEYIGPLLQTLAVAYDKYVDGDGEKKNFQSGIPSTRLQ